MNPAARAWDAQHRATGLPRLRAPASAARRDPSARRPPTETHRPTAASEGERAAADGTTHAGGKAGAATSSCAEGDPVASR